MTNLEQKSPHIYQDTTHEQNSDNLNELKCILFEKFYLSSFSKQSSLVH